MSIAYSFFPWVRQGAAAAIRDADPLTQPLPTEVAFPLALQLNTGDRVVVDLRLHGPADVVGIDRRQVIRTEPPNRTNNFLPNYFPAIEFDHPGFPWLFTPAKAEAQQGRLRPWLCLVVVRKQAGVTLRAGDPLPVLDIRTPAIARDELPDLSESWMWAHAQAMQDGSSLEDALDGPRGLSRLLCPCKLKPHAAYYACLVPTFEAGRRAGLNLSLTDANKTSLRPAWVSGENAPVEIQLPVYYHWEFSTGQAGDFEFLARQLTPRELPPGAGARTLQVGNAGIAHYEDFGAVNFAGVFRPAQFNSPLLPPLNTLPNVQRDWVQQLQETLEHNDDSADLDADSNADPIVGPPIYGHFQQSLLSLPGQSSWLRDLNLDARNRIAAGLGVLFVQAHQEDLMHSAWQQLGEVQQAQQQARQSELDQAVGEALYAKHFLPAVDRETLLYQMTAPAHSGVTVEVGETPQTVTGWAQQQQLPEAGTLATFRKLSRPQGPVSRRMQSTLAGNSPGNSTKPLLKQPLAIQAAETGPTDPKALANTLKPLASVVGELANRVSVWQQQATDNQAADRAAAAFSRLRPHLEKFLGDEVAPKPAPKPFNKGLQNQLVAALDPKKTGFFKLNQRSVRPLNATDASAEAPMAHPVFPQPMYEGIREFMPELLFPGADRIQDNTITLMETNPQFIESFMVGLNHEMARELIWRDYPTDQRGTYFRSFWSQGQPDLEELHTWQVRDRLGSNLSDGHTEGQLVLVIRGELLRRFPNTVFYAVRATSPSSFATDEEKYPLHRGQLTDDAIFVLFDLTEKQVRGEDGSHGWFFMIQQQPTEPRFGLEVEDWDKVALRGNYLAVSETGEDEIATLTAHTDATWGFNGAHMADITFQTPFRIAIHGKRFL
ncbi:MAG: hypothetical protein AAFV72_09420 [Cyanobacteria bacterium J06635_1]